jgi:hypothetical protein
VPRISQFYGIVISMYYNEHEPAHFHASHAGREASITLTGELLKGQLAPRILRLVREWAALHPVELRENWVRARGGLELERIPPLE